MKIHAICIVKDEADIISECLESAIEWADYIYVYDNGSDDETWEIVINLSKKYNQIVPFIKKNSLFYDGLRGEVYNYFRGQSSIGDWWCRLDADEFYIDDPRIFLSKIPAKYTAVSSASFQYYFTDKDLELCNKNPALYSDEVSVNNKCRYYLNNHGELRFVRHSKKFVWEKTQAWPRDLGRFYMVRIWLKHFQYRSPQQIQKRIEIRQEIGLRGASFEHEVKKDWSNYITRNAEEEFNGIDNIKKSNWKTRVLSADKLHYDAHDRRLVYSEKSMAPIRSGLLATKARKIINDLKILRVRLKKKSRILAQPD